MSGFIKLILKLCVSLEEKYGTNMNGNIYGSEEELFNRPLARPRASKNLLGGKKRKINGYDHRKFKPYRAKRGTRNRERLAERVRAPFAKRRREERSSDTTCGADVG